MESNGDVEKNIHRKQEVGKRKKVKERGWERKVRERKMLGKKSKRKKNVGKEK